MTGSHWFDTFHRLLTRAASRRRALAAVSMLVAALGLGEARLGETATAKKKHRRPKRKKQRERLIPCAQAECRQTFTDPADIDFCETKCGRCTRAGTEFCIHGPDEEHPDIHATCCPQDAQCCEDVCCDPTETCCDTSVGLACLPEGFKCCDEDTSGFCFPEQTCCPGVGCVEGTRCPDNECGGTCVGPGLQCCNGDCVNVETDANHCDGCNRPCPFGASCVLRGCRCPAGQEVCDGACSDECPCNAPQIPNPCPGLPGRCVTDQNYVCCVGHSCVVTDGEHPDDYECCGVAPDDSPSTFCRRFDDGRLRCAPGKGYPPLATHCSRDDPVCGG